MKNIIFITFILLSYVGEAQKFKSTSTDIKFYSDAPLEDIEAINKNATSIVNVESKAIVIVVPIKSFDFKKELMQEHFNENYLESDDYPNAIFKGKLIDWDGSDGDAKAKAEGTLELHGVTRDVTIEGDISKSNNSLKLSTVFKIKIEDYKIKIPKAVFIRLQKR
ncbi:YceI family protein [Ekhidna sp.]